MTIGIYIRVSTEDQTLEGQKNEITKWLENHGHEDVIWFEDKSTGTNTNRPGFQALQKSIFQGEIKTVVVYKLDRISRSLSDGIQVLTNWIDQDVRVVSVTQNLDFSGSVGRMIGSVLFSVAQMENETRRERQRHGIEVAKKKGVYKGRKTGTTKLKMTRVQELRDKGLSVREISDYLGISKSTVSNYFSKLKKESGTN